jgi:hypothetical protein
LRSDFHAVKTGKLDLRVTRRNMARKQISNGKGKTKIPLPKISRLQVATHAAEVQARQNYLTSKGVNRYAAAALTGASEIMLPTKTAARAGVSYLQSIISGSGDYVTNYGMVNQNACMVPSFKGSNSTVITKREFIGDVLSGPLSGSFSGFNIQGYPLNPAQSSLFPWLSMIASNYEQYDIQGMVFEFKSTSGDSVGVNTSLGTIIMATQYDPTKPAFTSKLAMEDYFFSTSFKPSVSALHAIECKNSLAPTGGLLYTRTGTVASSDLRWSDFGNFYIATQGMPNAGTVLGELWVSYKVKLAKPRLPITIGYGGQIASAFISRSGSATGVSLGNATTYSSGTLALSFPTPTQLSFVGIPLQRYFVSICIYATTSATLGITGLTGGVPENVFQSNTASGEQSSPGTSTNPVIFNYSLICQPSSPGGATVIQTSSTISGTATTDIFVTQVDTTAI